MKTVNNYLRLLTMTLVIGMFMTSCDDDESIDAPIAFFSAEADEENFQLISFTNETLNGDTYSWEFGDGTAASTDENPVHEYAEAGLYTVTLTATNGGGSNMYSEDITVLSAEPVNVIVNGGFDDASSWTLISHNTTGNGTLAIADGVATMTATDADWGGEGHLGMYQELVLEPGDYVVDFDISFDGVGDSWFETWVGPNEPVEGSDYGSDHGATMVVKPSDAWNCEVTYSGPAIAAGCGDTTGTITIETAGTYYICLRGGGLRFGATGYVIDNVTMVY
ncbi:MAG: PKD domain-containing protein [Reichenbachiella sp.]